MLRMRTRYGFWLIVLAVLLGGCVKAIEPGSQTGIMPSIVPAEILVHPTELTLPAGVETGDEQQAKPGSYSRHGRTMTASS